MFWTRLGLYLVSDSVAVLDLSQHCLCYIVMV